MARIQIIEQIDEIATLIGHVVGGLGHEAAFGSGVPAAEIDVLVVEPAAPKSLEAAKALRAARDDLPIVVVSIYPKSPETTALRPAAFIVKPFRLAELEQALRAAVASSPRLVPVASA